MKERKQNPTYLSPNVTVVAFKIEQGFAGTLTAEPIETTSGTTPGTEEVTQGSGLGDYFTRGN